MTENSDHPTPSLAKQKDTLRRNALARRDHFAADPANRLAAAQAVMERAIALCSVQDHPLAKLMETGTVVAGYWPIRSELDPRPLMMALADRGIALALPVTSPSGLMFRRWHNGHTLVSAGFGTHGPDHTQPIVDPAILLVPLAAFDRTGHRLGYGKGHYDGAIERLSAAHLAAGQRPLLTIGLAYDVQEIDVVPAEPHDQPLDVIITPMQSMLFK